MSSEEIRRFINLFETLSLKKPHNENHKDMFLEYLDTKYDFEWRGNLKKSIHASTRIRDQEGEFLRFKITFDAIYIGNAFGYDVEFSVDGEFGVSNNYGSTAARVFSAVRQSLEEVIIKFQPVFFKCHPATDSHDKLYRALANRLGKKFGWVTLDLAKDNTALNQTNIQPNRLSNVLVVCAIDAESYLKSSITNILVNRVKEIRRSRIDDVETSLQYAFNEALPEFLKSDSILDKKERYDYSQTINSAWHMRCVFVTEHGQQIQVDMENVHERMEYPWEIKITGSAGRQLPRIRDVRIHVTIGSILFSMIQSRAMSSVFLLLPSTSNYTDFLLMFRIIARYSRGQVNAINNYTKRILDPLNVGKKILSMTFSENIGTSSDYNFISSHPSSGTTDNHDDNATDDEEDDE